MAKIQGIQVTLINKQVTGYNPIGEPITSEVTTVVDNVLVSPASQDDIVNNLELYGKHAVYTLAIPKGDTHNWSNAEVEFFGRRFKTFGDVLQGIESLIPLDWNAKVQVEAFG